MIPFHFPYKKVLYVKNIRPGSFCIICKNKECNCEEKFSTDVYHGLYEKGEKSYYPIFLYYDPNTTDCTSQIEIHLDTGIVKLKESSKCPCKSQDPNKIHGHGICYKLRWLSPIKNEGDDVCSFSPSVKLDPEFFCFRFFLDIIGPEIKSVALGIHLWKLWSKRSQIAEPPQQ